MKTYQLPMTRDYVRHWDLKKAVQELLQNAIDSSAPFEHEFYDCGSGMTGLAIRSRGIELPSSSLLLGSTSKAENDNAIGSFGEGYKIALLVLTRLNKHPVVLNNGVEWSTSFEQSETFGAEVLTIEEWPNKESEGEGLAFHIEYLSEEDVAAIASSCLQMQNDDDIGKIIKCPQGDILMDKPGQLFVNGLYVCETKHRYGYSVKPAFLKLERDRQTVSSFDLSWVTKEMWFSTKENKLMAQMIADGVPDMEYANYGAPEKVKDACVEHFTTVNPPDTQIARSPEEVRDLKAAGATNPVYQNPTYHACVTAAPSYSPPKKVVDIHTPSAIIKRWYEENKKYMPRLPQVALKKIISDSEKWVKK